MSRMVLRHHTMKITYGTSLIVIPMKPRVPDRELGAAFLLLIWCHNSLC